MSGGWGRRSIQLAHFDYTRPGAYFVTICAYHRLDLFGSVEGGRVALWPVGEVVREEWLRTAIIRPEVGLDEFVIMPDHIHGIIVIRERFRGAQFNKRRGTSRWSPTPQTQILGFDSLRIQGRCDPSGTSNGRRSGIENLAKELLRQDHPQGSRAQCSTSVHSDKPGAMEKPRLMCCEDLERGHVQRGDGGVSYTHHPL